MATAPIDFRLSGLTNCLIQEGLLSENDAKLHAQEARKSKTPLISYLVSNKLVDSKKVASLAMNAFGIPFLDLDAIDKSHLPINLVSETLIRKHSALPIYKRGKTLFIAMSDPTNLQALDDIKFHSRLNPETILVEENKLINAIEASLESVNTVMSDLMDSDLDNLVTSSAGEEDMGKDNINVDIEDAPIVRFVNKILLDAIKKGVSDIHMEPYEKNFRIRFRADGILYTIPSPPANIASRIISRIKVMSKMDIAERRIPQDGRIKLNISKTRSLDFRVNTCPTLFGEKVVLRILDSTSAHIGIEKLGFEPEQERLFLQAINKPYGMVLVTGPTGSGKTVTLYTGLNLLNNVERNISTAEDPVEITVEGINQVNVNPKAGLTFANALRSFLRQDPDIIMVGEIRDLETAEIAVKAAQTGHLVLSTLHTNDAPQTLNRLVQMGIEPFNIVSAVNLIMAQRLARRLCNIARFRSTTRKMSSNPSASLPRKLNPSPFTARWAGENCTNGYKGRVGIYQVMTLRQKMRQIILEGGNAMQIADQAALEGINDLRASGLNKVRSGITSLEEIDRVTKD